VERPHPRAALCSTVLGLLQRRVGLLAQELRHFHVSTRLLPQRFQSFSEGRQAVRVSDTRPHRARYLGAAAVESFKTLSATARNIGHPLLHDLGMAPQALEHDPGMALQALVCGRGQSPLKALFVMEVHVVALLVVVPVPAPLQQTSGKLCRQCGQGQP